MDKTAILAKMLNPSVMSPRDVFESYAHLAAHLAEEQMELAACEVTMATDEAKMVLEGKTSAAARAIVRASDAGKDAIMLSASVKGSVECLRALKKMGTYLAEESRNQY